MPALNATITEVTLARLKSIKKRLELFSYADVIVRATIALEIILTMLN